MENKELSQNILQNIEQIKKYDSKLANEILMFENEKSNVVLAQNENGEYNLVYNSIPLHSIVGAVDEANNISKNIKNTENSIILIYGLGLGYLPDVVSNVIQNNKIIIYEPNLDLIKYVISIAKIDALFKENVVLCSNEEKLKEHVLNVVDENTVISISFLNSYKQLYLDDIKKVLYSAQCAQAQYIGNKNTFIKKAPLAFLHTIYNLKNIFSNPLITDLKDIYKDKTAIILCAGPSLREKIELIKKNQDKFVIFALSASLKLLTKHDIKPDFIVAIDSSDITKQFESFDTSKCYLISEAFTHSKIAANNFKKYFRYISSGNFFNDWVKDCLKDKSNLTSAGTVSYTAFKSAQIMGFKKIILIGQDLAYKDGQCYSRDCHFGALECVYNKDIKKYEIIAPNLEEFAKTLTSKKLKEEDLLKIARNYLMSLNNNICTVKSQKGDFVPSKTDYAIFIELFEQVAVAAKQENPNIELINSSLGGAQIDGFENVALDEVIKNLDSVEKLNLDNISFNIDKKHISEKIEKTINDFKYFKELLMEFLKLAENSLEYNAEQEKMLCEFFKLLDNVNLNFIAKVFLLSIEKYTKTPNSKELVSEVIEKVKLLIRYMDYVNKPLCDCKTFVLE